MAMHTELWFPSVIWSAMTHFANNAELKRWAYEKRKSDKGRKVSNQGGWQSNDILLGENYEIDKLVAYLNSEIKECSIQVGLPELEIQNIWININPPGAFNLLHNHLGSVLSGVYYVDASDYQGNIIFQRNDNAYYHIPENVNQHTYYTSTVATYRCKTGALYIFPGWLPHFVEGNKSNTDRISISFNYGEKK